MKEIIISVFSLSLSIFSLYKALENKARLDKLEVGIQASAEALIASQNLIQDQLEERIGTLEHKVEAIESVMGVKE